MFNLLPNTSWAAQTTQAVKRYRIMSAQGGAKLLPSSSLKDRSAQWEKRQ